MKISRCPLMMMPLALSFSLRVVELTLRTSMQVLASLISQHSVFTNLFNTLSPGPNRLSIWNRLGGGSWCITCSRLFTLRCPEARICRYLINQLQLILNIRYHLSHCKFQVSHRHLWHQTRSSLSSCHSFLWSSALFYTLMDAINIFYWRLKKTTKKPKVWCFPIQTILFKLLEPLLRPSPHLPALL